MTYDEILVFLKSGCKDCRTQNKRESNKDGKAYKDIH